MRFPLLVFCASLAVVLITHCTRARGASFPLHVGIASVQTEGRP